MTGTVSYVVAVNLMRGAPSVIVVNRVGVPPTGHVEGGERVDVLRRGVTACLDELLEAGSDHPEIEYALAHAIDAYDDYLGVLEREPSDEDLIDRAYPWRPGFSGS